MTTHAPAFLTFSEMAELLSMPAPELPPLGEWQFPLRRIEAGEALFRQGDRLQSTYVVRTGMFRCVFLRGATEHVVAFAMAGDALGTDAFGSNTHQVGSAAIERAEVAVVPPLLLKQMDCRQGRFAPLLFEMLCRENQRKMDLVTLLARSSAIARIAAFLLDFGGRLARRGYSVTSFRLPMRQADLASHLALRAETLSRAFSAINASGLAEIHLKAVAILDAPGLRGVADGLPLIDVPTDGSRKSHAISAVQTAWAGA